MKVLVTGGAGFIGSHVCKRLAYSGYQPVVYDDLGHGFADAVRWGPLEVGALGDRARLDQVIRQHRPEAVMHFAGLIAVGESVAKPGLYYRNNVADSLVLLEAVRDHGIGLFVFSSTAAVYGVPEIVPIPEDHRTAPVNPYGATKLAMEWMLADFGVAHGVRSVCLRYFNAAGADPDGALSERHDPETHALPLAIQAALGRRDCFQIFGTDYDTPDGTAIRDYIHVEDLATAHVRALEWLRQGGAGAVLNLGTGCGTSVQALVEAVTRVTGRAVPVRHAPRRAGDPPVLIAAPERALAVLGWQPLWTNFDRIVETAVLGVFNRVH
jgi:UDP-glucose-4-epimerase GalE